MKKSRSDTEKVDNGLEKEEDEVEAGTFQDGERQHCHGWEIAVILRNFRKTKLSKSKFLFVSFFFLNSISTCIQCATR